MLPVVLMLAAQLAGCGGGRSLPQGGPPTAQGPAPTSERTPVGSSGTPLAPAALTRSRAEAFARAVNLAAADIPEASVTRKAEARSNPAEQGELDRCEHASGRAPKPMELNSPRLVRGVELESEEIRSYVAVWLDGRSAAREISRVDSRGVRECVARVLTRRFDDKSVREARWGRVSVSPLAVHAPGTDAALGIRVAATLNLKFSEVTVPIYVDLLAFASGPAAVELSAVSVTQPVPTATEQRLLSLLLGRVQANPL
jgi:hypothetical protein